STFALLYCLQPLMPVFSRDFHVGAAPSSLSLSVTTGVLAVAVLVTGSLSEAWGRKPMMVVSLFASAALTIMSALVTGWHGLLAVRAVEGLTFAGLPALAMAYLSEEMHAGSIGLAMGLYISGTGLGGMGGRLLAAALTDVASWRVALFTIGVLGVVAAVMFWRSLPPSAHFHRRALAWRTLFGSFAAHLRDARLVLLFVEGFLVMGGFVTIYNYISYRLVAPPYDLSQTLVGSIFLVYLVGTVSSTWIGDLAGRKGRDRVLLATIAIMLGGVVVTLAHPLAIVILGLAVVTFGFFGAHSVASSWVGLRAQHGRAQASALYLFFYYLGSSIAGWAGGIFWSAWGWWGVAGFVGALLVIALLVALGLAAHVAADAPPLRALDASAYAEP
ncbi:MAG TPA: MFS transporter, partial [Gemmatimonadaceae bacterium]|nr:MFS transporter [Gemmatimonadaceae bacterium]